MCLYCFTIYSLALSSYSSFSIGNCSHSHTYNYVGGILIFHTKVIYFHFSEGSVPGEKVECGMVKRQT